MFSRHHHTYAVYSAVILLTAFNYFADATKIVYSFPSSGPGGASAKSSSSSSSQFVGAVKKREDLPGFESDENFGPAKGYAGPSTGDGGGGGGGGGGGPAYSVSSFSTGDASGFSTHVKHDIPRRSDTPPQKSPEFYFPSPEERPEPSRLFSSYFAQDEPTAEFREASGSSNDEKHLEEIRKHMEIAEKSSAFDDEARSGGAGGAGEGPTGEPSSFNDEEPSLGQNSGQEEEGIGCKNCNYAQFQMEH